MVVDGDGSVLQYIDTNSSRAEISTISSKLEQHRIGIIGLGGTGTYILDFLSKTPVAEIRIIDGDDFLQHNAFRCPGAAEFEQLNKQLKKVNYLQQEYSRMHKNIVPITEFIDEDNLGLLDGLDFVFICMDKGYVKGGIFDKLESDGVSFIDVGIGVDAINGALISTVRTTLSTQQNREHLRKRVDTSDIEDDEYSSNIQIAELNAVNACYAVIRWKKHVGFYHDHENEYNGVYTLNTHQLIGEDHEA